jgi:hypothetical protein
MLESPQPNDRQTGMVYYLAQIENDTASALTQPSSLLEVNEGTLQQFATEQVMKLDI